MMKTLEQYLRDEFARGRTTIYEARASVSADGVRLEFRPSPHDAHAGVYIVHGDSVAAPEPVNSPTGYQGLI